MAIKLSIPSRQTQSNITVETRPKQVKEWLDALPLANSFDAARKLADALVASQTAKLGEEARLKLLELYRQTVWMLLPSLQQEYVGKPLPLAEKAKQAANLARELLNELANGYKMVVLDISQRRVSFGVSKLAPVALQHAIECLAEILDICYETYAPTPAGIWLELHQLYWYAARNKLHQEQFTEGGQTLSVNATYKQALLVALADPYRLLQGQLQAVKAYLLRAADLVALQPLTKVETTQGLYLLCLDSDKPPKPLAHHTGVTDERTDILLNTIPLARSLHQQLQGLEAGQAPAAVDLPEAAKQAAYRELLKRLLKQWGIGAKRMFNRVATDGSTYVCSGIRSLHHALAGDGEPDLVPETEEAEEEVQITVQVAAPTDQTGQHTTYNCSSWYVLNESAGGMALSKDPKSIAKIRVGDLIGLASGPIGATRTWGVAAVRWIHADTPGQVDLGAQFLSPKAEPIAIKPTISSAEAPFQPALLLPELPSLKQPDRIVAQRGNFLPNREFELRYKGISRIVRATKLLEQTDSFEMFLFSST
jgi:hypothetical protein